MGPGLIWTTWPRTSNSAHFSTSTLASSRSSSSRTVCGPSPALSSVLGGSLKPLTFLGARWRCACRHRRGRGWRSRRRGAAATRSRIRIAKAAGAGCHGARSGLGRAATRLAAGQRARQCGSPQDQRASRRPAAMGAAGRGSMLACAAGAIGALPDAGPARSGRGSVRSARLARRPLDRPGYPSSGSTSAHAAGGAENAKTAPARLFAERKRAPVPALALGLFSRSARSSRQLRHGRAGAKREASGPACSLTPRS